MKKEIEKRGRETWRVTEDREKMWRGRETGNFHILIINLTFFWNCGNIENEYDNNLLDIRTCCDCLKY